MKIIGITGGIGGGKSELLAYIKKHYLCEVYLADEVAHLVKEKGTSCYDRLVSLLGEDVLDAQGEIDKGKMADRIFADRVLLKEVNEILHPAVREYLDERVRKAKECKDTELFFVEAALLLEAGYRDFVDELWYVHADETIRRERLRSARGYTDEKTGNIMGNQLSEDVFRRECDFVIDNSGALADSFAQIDKKLEAFSWRD